MKPCFWDYDQNSMKSYEGQLENDLFHVANLATIFSRRRITKYTFFFQIPNEYTNIIDKHYSGMTTRLYSSRSAQL